MYEDTKVSQLVINHLTEEKFKELLENDELDQNQLYMTDDRAGYTPPLLSTLWSDHTINDISWLCADTFSWQSGDVYVAAYNHLVTDFEGTTAETETIGNIEITFYRAEDGHKICLPDQESNILALYEATGVAWYYILDTTNKQFKLPRSKHNKYADTVPVVGNGMALGLTNGTTNFGLSTWNTSQAIATTAITGAYGAELPNTGGGGSYPADSKNLGVTTDPEKSGLMAQQAQDTNQYKYLYFYVGNFEQSAIEQTAGLDTELFNGKADVNLMNTTSNVDFVVESQLPTSDNGYTWYRKYKNGWVEQGGIVSSDGQKTYVDTTLPLEMADANYTISTTTLSSSTSLRAGHVNADLTTTTSFRFGYVNGTSAVDFTFSWQASGVAAE